MNLFDSICGFIDSHEWESAKKHDNGLGPTTCNASDDDRIDAESAEPRDGMSAESARFMMGKCANKKAFKIFGVQNNGRYFTANILDYKGNLVNQILVDKLNGRVKFIK